MGKTATITTRIEPQLKRNAESVLGNLGVNTTDAITIAKKMARRSDRGLIVRIATRVDPTTGRLGNATRARPRERA